MKIAIATWNDHVSSTFDFSARILLIESESDKEISRSQIVLESQSLLQRVSQMKSLEVDVLICGAISRMLADMLTASEIEVLAYVTGNVNEVLDAYRSGELAQLRFAMPGCWPGARKWLGRCGPKKGRCRRCDSQKKC